MKKILIETNLKSGGIEKFLINLMRDLHPSECELHFAVPYAEDHIEFYEPFVKEWGGAVIHKLGGNKEAVAYNRKSLIRKRFSFYKLLHSVKFDTCYINVGGAGAAHLIETYMSILCKVPNIIVHSPTSEMSMAREKNNTRIKKNVHRFLRWLWPNRGRVKYLACSKLAAKWLFPWVYQKGNYEFIPYSIETSRFRYDESIRSHMREKYGIHNELVILNVGRLSKQKNHIFLIKVFRELVKIKPDSKLVLVGEGELEEKIKLFIEELGLQSKVIMVGAVTDVFPYYSMADLFLFPSLYEGLGIVLLEAQSNGIPILVSDCIPSEVKVTDLIKFISLKENEKIWAEKTLVLLKKGRNNDAINSVVKGGFDITNVNVRMRKILGLGQ